MIHNQLTNYAQLLAGFRRMLGEMGADFSGIERAGETLTPIMDLWALPEWALLRGEVLFARQLEVAPVAARFSSVELVNPVGSGVLAVVHIIDATFLTDELNMAVDSGAAIAANPVTNRGVAVDTRFPQLGEVSRCTIVTGDVAAGIALNQWRIRQAVSRPALIPFILRPGQKLFMISSAVLQSVQLGIFFSERPLLPNEQSP